MTVADPPGRPLVVHLHGEGVETRDAGGKGAALDRLIAAGYPVPPTGVVCAQSYRMFVRETGIESELERLTSPSTLDRLDTDGQIERLFLSVITPDVIVEGIEDLLAELASHTPSDGPGPTFVVRSSATAEDTAHESFAGLYTSKIDVPSFEVIDALKRVWASLWSAQARTYRSHRGVDEHDLAMAAVIMPFIAPSLAGVVFTADPGGLGGHLRIEFVHGLGERLVSGAETPDALVVPRARPRDILGEHAELMDELADLVLDVEHRLGAPQDIEWLVTGGRLMIVQSRPITVATSGADDDDGFDTPPIPGASYTAAGVDEMLPGVVPPLLWSLNGHALEEAFRSLLAGLDVLPSQLIGAHGFVGRSRGRAALNLDLLEEAAASMPGGSAAEMERQYFGRVITRPDQADDDQPSMIDRVRGVVPATRAMRLRRRAQDEAAALSGAIDLLGPADLGSRTDDELLVSLSRLEDVADRLTSCQLRIAAAAAASYRTLELFLARYLDDEAPRVAQQLTSGALTDFAGTTSLAIGALRHEAARESVVDIILEHDDVADGLLAIESHSGDSSFVRAWHQALAESGSTTMFAGETWADHPDGAWEALRASLSRPPSVRHEDALVELEARLTGTRKWKTMRVITGQIIDVRKRILRRTVADSVSLLQARERSKGALLRLGGHARRVIEELADRLVARGALEQARHVELLSRDELADALGGRGPSTHELARRRSALDAAERSGPLPEVFEGPAPKVALEGRDGDVLHGWAASPGTHTGTVRIVESPKSARLAEGDVLVAAGTDPSWTPLFLRAGAIVVERGGPLSHAAILARELGLPAVLNARGAVSRLRDVHAVTVDGSAGTVEINDDGPGADDADDRDHAGVSG